MQIKATFCTRQLLFNFAAQTSRGKLKHKDSLFIKVGNQEKFGIGEVSILPGITRHSLATYKAKIQNLCSQINQTQELVEIDQPRFPELEFAMNCVKAGFNNTKHDEIFKDSSFLNKQEPIEINGLIWMGDIDFMVEQLHNKVAQGFTCIKVKVGANRLKDELMFLKNIRSNCSSKLEIRLDANGAFNESNVYDTLNAYAKFDIHSIEQPILPAQPRLMSQIVQAQIIPIVLDEEIIFCRDNYSSKQEMVDKIQPDYLVLKPGLIGSFKQVDEYISLMPENKWWVTSALESNVGLNAIAQYTSHKKAILPQGLGTGALFSNNINSPLEVKGNHLLFNKSKGWELDFFS